MGYPTLIADGKRIKKIGIDAWIEEQEERVKTGFAYADIRCYPYEVPMNEFDPRNRTFFAGMKNLRFWLFLHILR